MSDAVVPLVSTGGVNSAALQLLNNLNALSHLPFSPLSRHNNPASASGSHLASSHGMLPGFQLRGGGGTLRVPFIPRRTGQTKNPELAVPPQANHSVCTRFVSMCLHTPLVGLSHRVAIGRERKYTLPTLPPLSLPIISQAPDEWTLLYFFFIAVSPLC